MLKSMKSLIEFTAYICATESAAILMNELIYQLFHRGSQSKHRADALGKGASLPVIDLVNVVN